MTHADVLTVSRDSELFSSEVGGVTIMDADAEGGFDTRGVMLHYTDPPKHTRYRKLVNKGFTPRMIGLLEQYLQHRSRQIVDNVIERGSCDFVVDLASELPLQAIAEIMGVPQEDRHLIFEWSNAIIGADDPEFVGGAEGAHEASAQLYAYVNELAKERHRDPRRHRHQAHQCRSRGREALRGRVRHVHAAALGRGERDDAQHDVVGHVGADAEPGPVRRALTTTPTRSCRTRSRRSCAGRRLSTTSVAPPPRPPRSRVGRSPRATRS